MKKRNLPVIILGVGFLVLALVLILVTAYLANWDMAAYFKSQNFIWVCVALGVYLILVAVYFMFEKWRNL